MTTQDSAAGEMAGGPPRSDSDSRIPSDLRAEVAPSSDPTPPQPSSPQPSSAGFSPARLAAPLLGGEGTRFGRPDQRAISHVAWLLMGLLGLSTLIGLLIQAPCLVGGYDLPRAGFRMCQSPLALSMMGESIPESLGRVTSGLGGFAPLTYWFVVLMTTAGVTAGEAMGLLLVVNVLAIALGGVGLLVLARSLGFVAQPSSGDDCASLIRPISVSWVAVAFVSPLIVFSIGQSLDPVGVALAVWACVLANGSRSTPALLSAGVLLAVASFASPLGLIVLIGVLVGASRDRGNAVLVLAGWALAAGMLTLLDGRLPSRLSVWFADAVDRGSLLSVVLAQDWGDESAFVTGLLTVWVMGVVAVAAVAVSKMMRGTGSIPAAEAPKTSSSRLTVLRHLERADDIAHLRQTVLTMTVLLGISVIVAPGSSTSMALWLLPFAALTVRNLWVLGLWFAAELSFAVAVPLSDVSVLDASTGLSTTWMSVFTLLRFFTLVLVTTYALDELLRVGKHRTPNVKP